MLKTGLALHVTLNANQQKRNETVEEKLWLQTIPVFTLFVFLLPDLMSGECDLELAYLLFRLTLVKRKEYLLSTGGCAFNHKFLAKLFLLFALINNQKTLLKRDREIEGER